MPNPDFICFIYISQLWKRQNLDSTTPASLHSQAIQHYSDDANNRPSLITDPPRAFLKMS